MTFFPGKISILRPKISDDFFLVIDQVFQILRLFTVLNVVYDPFFTRKSTISKKNSLIRPFFYSVRTFARIRQRYFSKYWGDQCMGRPHLKFFFGGTVPPVPLRSPPLNLCMIFIIRVHLCMHVWSFNVKFQSVYICLCLYAYIQTHLYYACVLARYYVYAMVYASNCMLGPL